MSYDLPKTVCIKETPKAILVESESMEATALWIPKSGIHADSEVEHVGEEGTLWIEDWCADLLEDKL